MESGYDKFSEEMDIVNIIMKIRKHQVAIKSSILCCDEKDFLVEHAQQNIIQFDTTTEEEVDPEPKDSGHEESEEDSIEQERKQQKKIEAEKGDDDGTPAGDDSAAEPANS